jgi:hypothetical protein
MFWIKGNEKDTWILGLRGFRKARVTPSSLPCLTTDDADCADCILGRSQVKSRKSQNPGVFQDSVIRKKSVRSVESVVLNVLVPITA